jgi:hypothetical protein
MDVLPALVNKWGTASSSVAADWYDELRQAQGISGHFTAIAPPLDNLGAEALAGWAAEPLQPKQPGTPTPPISPAPRRGGLRFTTTQDESAQSLHIDTQPVDLDMATAQYRAEGGLQKRLVNAANLTVTTSANQDPKARGWMRRTQPGACKFCVMVASRGSVFTKASSTFACHEHCYCEAIPAWGGQPLPVGPYRPSDRPSTAADRARVREWIAKNL